VTVTPIQRRRVTAWFGTKSTSVYDDPESSQTFGLTKSVRVLGLGSWLQIRASLSPFTPAKYAI
jgi:hypothetical protein